MRRCVFHKELRSMKSMKTDWENKFPTASMLIRLSELRATLNA